MDKIKQQAQELVEDIYYEINNIELDDTHVMHRLAEAVGLIEELIDCLDDNVSY